MLSEILKVIVADPELHTKWLNTLSMMENAGAKKIKNCEHPIFVNEIILKHSAEEARHAYYLKKQIRKIDGNACPTYERKYLLSPQFSPWYLHQLDIEISRYIKDRHHIFGDRLRYAAYLLVTYAIEVRADELYPEYQEVLTANGSSVNVKSIILEEENHLKEMHDQLSKFSPDWEKMCEDVKEMESRLYAKWVEMLNREILKTKKVN